MAAFDSELMALVNAVHQLGSSAAVIGRATETRFLLSILRQLYRDSLAIICVDELRPPLAMYHSFRFEKPPETRFHVVLADLGSTIDHLAQVGPTQLFWKAPSIHVV